MLLDLEKFDLPSIAEAVVENFVITDQLSQTDSNKVLAALLLRHRHQYQMTQTVPRRPSSYNLWAMARKDSKSSFPAVDSENKPIIVGDSECNTTEDGTIRLKIDDTCANISDQEIIEVGIRSTVPLRINLTANAERNALHFRSISVLLSVLYPFRIRSSSVLLWFHWTRSM